MMEEDQKTAEPTVEAEQTPAVTGEAIIGDGFLRQGVGFNRRQFIISIVALGLVGVTMIVLSFAMTPDNGDFEAETMSSAATDQTTVTATGN